MFVQHGMRLPSNIVETQCLPVITALLQQSHMLAALPEEAVQSCCKAGLLTVLTRNLPLSVGAFGIITRKHHKLSPGAQLLLSSLREQARQMYPVVRYAPACARKSLA
jgi:DNA-binding transcriptional LysR family regulator